VQLGLLVLLAAASSPTRAPLRLQLDQCPDMDRMTVRRVVSMELEASLATESQAGAITTASAQCADGRVHLIIEDPVTGKRMTRTLDLEDQPRPLRSRLLGLAISEAVLASWLELQLTPEPTPSRPDAVAQPEARRAAAHIAERRLQEKPPARAKAPAETVIGTIVRRFSSGLLTFGLSGSARHWLDRSPHAGIGIDTDVGYGEQSVSVARAKSVSMSMAPSLLMRSSFGRITVAAGAGWRLSMAWLSGEPANPFQPGRAGWRAWTGPFLSADLGVPLSGSLFLRASVEIGHVLVPARGRLAATTVIALEGSWLGGLLSVGTTL